MAITDLRFEMVDILENIISADLTCLVVIMNTYGVRLIRVAHLLVMFTDNTMWPLHMLQSCTCNTRGSATGSVGVGCNHAYAMRNCASTTHYVLVGNNLPTWQC